MTDDVQDWSERLRREGIANLEALQEMQEQVAQVFGEATALHGSIKVRVTAAGMPLHLEIADEALAQRGSELASMIMTTIAEATVQAAEQLRRIVGSVVPAEELDAMLRGTVSDSDRRDVREQLAQLRGESG
ncbi:YbaB/EbfC family nucleoid-associated protein [Nocardioides limicola]|uniref:YbaB/EbfC family nucleoid-associated protein n=1 Tax=Nocardioides limicola TaxID=2803368 RepID=UPI00193C712C|nr:YbaB/EbfC family nucleoid-associated protein [Nocardioides sp. DJM-14]